MAAWLWPRKLLRMVKRSRSLKPAKWAAPVSTMVACRRKLCGMRRILRMRSMMPMHSASQHKQGKLTGKNWLPVVTITFGILITIGTITWTKVVLITSRGKPALSQLIPLRLTTNTIQPITLSLQQVDNRFCHLCPVRNLVLLRMAFLNCPNNRNGLP